MESNETNEDQTMETAQVPSEKMAETEVQTRPEQVVGTGHEGPPRVQPAWQDPHGSKAGRPWLKPLVISLATIAVAVGSFFGGMKYQESKEPAPAVMESAVQDGQAGAMQPGGPMGQGMGMPGAMGEVTAVSSSSISIEDMRSGEVSTYDITTSTEILDNGEAARASDIEVGDDVMVIASDSDSSIAEQIMIDPRMGGPGGEGFEPPSTNS